MRQGGQKAACSYPPAMPPASSSTTPASWRTSSVCRPGTRARPPTSRGYGFPGQQRDLDHLGLRAKSVLSDGQRPGQTTLTDILSSLRALAEGRYQAHRVTAPTAPSTPPQTPPGKTRTRPPGTRSEAGHAQKGPLLHGLRRPLSTTTGRPVRSVAPMASDVGNAARRSRARGEAHPSGCPPGRAWTRNRRTQNGGQSW